MTSNFVVHIIESPSARDILDKDLEGRVLHQAVDVSRIESTYLVACDKDSFWEAVGNRFLDAISDDNFLRWPFLHLSAHGSADGIQLTNKEFIPWGDLTEYFQRLNSALQGRLLVAVSSCHGAFAAQETLKGGDSPYFALVGPADEIPLPDLAVGFSAFYHILSKTWDLHAAHHAMTTASGNQRFKLFITEELRRDYEAHLFQEKIKRILANMQSAGTPETPTPGGG